ncbi:OadG family protein [Bacillus sp. FJAT-49736]|uniref:OadG family protein n=1 Tax=Bacillus sp. FJAT-49736 TaxID=2833582 RepID=UPI001BC917DB|nr:OadG family protein [Bacillus sp. FJAT-49736]MBS4174396.1 OadG family protein [Bacillus sp. FJAT-49736]
MGYVFLALIIIVIGFTLFKMIKKKSLPSNQYTPYDDIMFGKKFEATQNETVQDTKHTPEYQESEK